MSRDCVHGLLARSCEMCELSAEVDRLMAERNRIASRFSMFRWQIEGVEPTGTGERIVGGKGLYRAFRELEELIDAIDKEE